MSKIRMIEKSDLDSLEVDFKSIDFFPSEMQEGIFNLYAIGVKKDLQGKGRGQDMMSFLEERFKAFRSRILIVETSGSDDFKLTRKFYENLNYSKEAVLRDFWSEGDDKVIYWKKLN